MTSKMNIDTQWISPRFSVENSEELQQGVEYLDTHGYAVFSGILSDEEIQNDTDLFWKFLKNLNIRRDYPSTWGENWPGSSEIGVINDHGIGQSEFLWAIRGNRNVKKVFAKIWNSKELFTSFDGAGCYRNWSINHQWKTMSKWYHCDQNPFQKPDRCSIQGLVSLTDSDESTGGLVLIPKSHHNFHDLQLFVEETRLRGDFVSIPSELIEGSHPCLIKCQAGDLIVWDSRSIHCNTPALIHPVDKQNSILRIVAYVCMSPAELFVPDGIRCENLEEFRELREDFVRQRITCTHWPLEMFSTSRVSREEILPLKLTAYQHSLIIGTDLQSDDENKEMSF